MAGSMKKNPRSLESGWEKDFPAIASFGQKSPNRPAVSVGDRLGLFRVVYDNHSVWNCNFVLAFSGPVPEIQNEHVHLTLDGAGRLAIPSKLSWDQDQDWFGQKKGEEQS